MKREVIILIGSPASGKTSIAKTLQELDYTRFSADVIRGELYGNEGEQGNPGHVFSLFRHRVRDFFNFESGNCVIDNTNTSSRDRKNIIDLIERPEDFNIRYWLLDVPVEICLERNNKRDRKVPEEAIIRKSQNVSRQKIMSDLQLDLIIGPEGKTKEELKGHLGL